MEGASEVSRAYEVYPLKKEDVSEFVYLFVYLFPNSSETANPNELKFWGMIPLGMQKVLG